MLDDALPGYRGFPRSVVAAVLILMVFTAWLGVLGFARLRVPIDRLRCVTFVSVTSGILLLLAATVSDRFSDRCGKIMLIVGFNILGGAASSHVIARAVWQRAGSGD